MMSLVPSRTRLGRARDDRNTSERNIPSLDGLRAISIGFVVLGHLGAMLHWSPPIYYSAFAVGRLGVRIFFVISGFLITSLLWSELNKSGTVNLRRFYLRRTLRIFPAYYAFIVFVLSLSRIGLSNLPDSDFTHAAAYLADYYPCRWHLAHTWSLAVEEQFYLLWPAVIMAFGKSARFGAIAVVLVCPLLRILIPSTIAFHAVADALAMGCVLAIWRDRFTALLSSRRWRSPLVFIAAGFVARGIEAVAARPALVPSWIVQLCLISVQDVSVAILVCWAVANHEGFVGSLLNSSGFSYLGRLSYSLYLWQQIFLVPHDAPEHPLVKSWPFALAGAFACTIGSYYGVERPMLRFRSWLDRRLFARQPDRRALAGPVAP